MTRTWSDQQQQIFRWFGAGQGNLIVRARAGTGKTTTIVEALAHAPERRILLCAFNKRIAVELQGRIANPAAEAATLHSVGFACIRRFWDRVKIDDKGARGEWLAREACPNGAPDAAIKLVKRLHTVARETAPLTTDWRDLRALAYAQDCVPDAEWADEGFDLDWTCKAAYDAMKLAASSKPLATGIDFSDMIFLPVRNRWLRARYDLVIVDEAQDMNAAQLLIARGVANGRIAVVGDDRQAIYGFRGADSGSLDRLKVELGAQELGLTTTYRCGKVIVDRARQIVPDFEAGANNPAGVVRTIMADTLANAVAVGDFVLSRKNAPLAKVALRILRAGKRARIEGRDLGAGLKALVARLATGKVRDSMPVFLGKLAAWEEREVTRAAKSNDKLAEQQIERISDQADTIRVLADGLSGVRELQTRIEDLFSDGGGARVICSTIHRAKGLEADRVFLLTATLVTQAPCACGHWSGAHDKAGGGCARCACSRYAEDAARLREEENLEYVAITRAKHELVLVDGTP